MKLSVHQAAVGGRENVLCLYPSPCLKFSCTLKRRFPKLRPSIYTHASSHIVFYLAPVNHMIQDGVVDYYPQLGEKGRNCLAELFHVSGCQYLREMSALENYAVAKTWATVTESNFTSGQAALQKAELSLGADLNSQGRLLIG